MKVSAAKARAGLDAILASICNGTAGKLRIYSGSAPANVAATRTGTKLSETTIQNATTAFGSSAGDPPVATGNLSGGAFSKDLSITATGTAGYWDIIDAGGTVVAQGSLGVSGSGAELILSSVSLIIGGTVTISYFTVTLNGAV